MKSICTQKIHRIENFIQMYEQKKEKTQQKKNLLQYLDDSIKTTVTKQFKNKV